MLALVRNPNIGDPSTTVIYQSGVDWLVSVIEHQPFAVYRLRVTPGPETSLLTIQVMADKDGKCGAAQVVHVMNVMCGFEECEGLSA